MIGSSAPSAPKGMPSSFASRTVKDWRRNNAFYLMAIPALVYYIIFHYVPMYGAQIAFRDYHFAKGILGSPWVGIKHFRDFVTGFYFVRLVRNTFLLSFYSVIFGFPAPILLALLLNEIRISAFKRTVQTITYMPHFVSVVVICGILVNFSASGGVFNAILGLFGKAGSSLLQNPAYFRTIYVASGVWSGIGWGSIIYLAAISGIDQEQYEAAIIDGAGRLKQAIYVTLPNILPTISILLILRMGGIMNVGHEKVLLLYNSATWSTSDIISTYVYREGLVRLNYSGSAAIGMMNSAINIIFLLFSNWLSAKVSENSLF